MTILLSGSTGFLGSYLLKKFVEAGYNVIAIKRSDSNTYRIDDFLEKIVCYDIDVVEFSSIFEAHKIDVVVNTVTNYGRADQSITAIVKTNLNFGLKLLEEAVSNKVTAYINTDTLLNRDINAYALSKAQLVDWMKFLSNQSTKMINVKIEHMYGVLDDENKFIYWLINQLKKNVDSIDLTSGVQKRDFVYIDDIVSAYESILSNIDKLAGYEEFELGSGIQIDVKSFIETIYKELQQCQEVNTRLNFGAVNYRANENMDMKADISKLKALGWEANISVAEGIKRVITGENGS